jgi:hypothetical protein
MKPPVTKMDESWSAGRDREKERKADDAEQVTKTKKSLERIDLLLSKVRLS